MKRLVLFMIAIFHFSACGAQSNQIVHDNKVINKDQLVKDVEALVKFYQDIDIFSGVVLIAQRGVPVYQKAFGLADREKNIKNTISTKFDIGSMNKTFTKVVIFQLIEEGKLKLNDHLSDFLPQFSDRVYAKITVEHLLNHASGFGDYYMTPGYFDLPIEQKNISSLVELIVKMPLHFEPGTEQEYSNSGYILLGAIIEKITRKSYHQNVQDRIVSPLKLNDTYVENKYQVPNRAIGYFKTMKGDILDNNGFVEMPNPDGGFQSTSLDILKFYQEFYYGQNLIKEVTKQQDEFYQMFTAHQNTGGAITQAGGFEGANTVNFEIVRDKITIIVFANMNEPVAEQLGAGILAIIRGQEPKIPSLPAIENVYKAYAEYGIDYIRDNFDNLSINFHPSDPKALILNQIGYEFLRENQIEEAIEIFALNTKMFPDDANVWDSLGEGYLAKGEKDKAKTSYLKALELNPEFPSALTAISKLNN